MISSFGNHPTSLLLFCFFSFLPATPLKEPHTKELCFPAQPLLPVTAMPAMTLLVLSWWSGENKQIRRDCQSLERPERLHSCPVWSPQTGAHVSISQRCEAVPAFALFMQHTTCLCLRQTQAISIPLFAALLLGSCSWQDVSSHQFSSQLFPLQSSCMSVEAEDHILTDRPSLLCSLEQGWCSSLTWCHCGAVNRCGLNPQGRDQTQENEALLVLCAFFSAWAWSPQHMILSADRDAVVPWKSTFLSALLDAWLGSAGSGQPPPPPALGGGGHLLQGCIQMGSGQLRAGGREPRGS